MAELIRCPECNVWKDVENRCVNCRSIDRYRRKGVVVDQRCKACLAIKRLRSNGECAQCLREAGMRECSVCHKIAIQALDFKHKQSVCKRCRHPLGHLTAQERTRHARYMRTYGISYDEYIQRAEAQAFLCAVCKKKRRLVVDHDHTTKKVRGLLCANCDVGIGMLKDTPAILQAAAAYLEQQGTAPLATEDEGTITHRQEHIAKVNAADLAALREELADAQQTISELHQRPGPDLMLAIVKTSIDLVEKRRRPLTEDQVERYSTWLNNVLQRL